MISFFQDESRVPDDLMSKTYKEFTTLKVQEALIAKFGKLPPMEEVAKHCHCIYAPDKTAYYLWLENPPKVGDTLDLSDCLCIVEPPL